MMLLFRFLSLSLCVSRFPDLLTKLQEQRLRSKYSIPSQITTRTATTSILSSETSGNENDINWIDLNGSNDQDLVNQFTPHLAPVRKRILKEGSGMTSPKGSTVHIEYIGTYGNSPKYWSDQDVLECWLINQQGLYDILSQPFITRNINGSKLLDPNYFNEDFVSKELGLSNRIQCMKVVMAARKLQNYETEYPIGTVFDSSTSRGSLFSFILGVGKVIKGMDLAVSSMKVGEKSTFVFRSDYAYGSEGYRRTTGEVIVPPYATLCFDISLISCS